ncbi:MAG: glycosyltransferase [Crinalium sp.]
MTILQFTLPQHPSLGGIYVTQGAFKKILNSKIVEIVPSQLRGKTEGDYQIELFGAGGFKGNLLPKNFFDLMSHLESLDVNLVIIHSLFHLHAIAGYWLAKKKKIPYVFVPHGTLDPYVFSYRALRKNLWMSLVGNKIIQDSTAVICSTLIESQKASKYLDGNNVEICHWSVNTPNLDEISVWRNEIRNRLDIPSEQRVLIFIGRLNHMKRPLETALAFKQLQPKDWRLLIVGPPEEDNLARDIKNLCDGQYIQYYPPVYGLDKWKFLAAADAFICLSHRENFGRSVVEAAAVGMPIIISDGVDIYPILQEAGGSDVINIKFQSDLIKGLDLFLQKPVSIHKEMGQKAHKCFKENFTESYFRDKLNNLISKYEILNS